MRRRATPQRARRPVGRGTAARSACCRSRPSRRRGRRRAHATRVRAVLAPASGCSSLGLAPGSTPVSDLGGEDRSVAGIGCFRPCRGQNQPADEHEPGPTHGHSGAPGTRLNRPSLTWIPLQCTANGTPTVRPRQGNAVADSALRAASRLTIIGGGRASPNAFRTECRPLTTEDYDPTNGDPDRTGARWSHVG